MTEREKAARAIGYLEGLSALLWCIGDNAQGISLCPEACDYYDQQVDILRKAIFEEKPTMEDRFARFNTKEIEKGLDRVDRDGD